MRINRLGRTGLFVSELCLGTMTFGGEGETWRKMGDLAQADATALLARAVERGVNFVDTADVYSNGLSERITGQAIRDLGLARHEIVVATKGYGTTGRGPNGGGNTRGHLIDACKASLKRLGLDHIDLYQVHGFDPATPIEETVRALDILVQHGHVRYVGVSNWAAWQVSKALGIAERLNLSRFESLQAYYTIAGRDLEREIVPMLRDEALGLMVWSPLAGGLLSGKYGRDRETAADGRRAGFDFPPVDRDLAWAAVDAMRPIAEARGVSVAAVAIAWLLHRRAVDSVIVGARRLEQLDDTLAAADLVLSGEELDRLDAASPPSRTYPGWMFDQQAGRRNLLAGGNDRPDRR